MFGQIRRRNKPLPIGDAGELVITTLTTKALPMVRYRTRDITRLSDMPPPCGSAASDRDAV